MGEKTDSVYANYDLQNQRTLDGAITLVCQMGKVASISMDKTLSRFRPTRSVYHTHFLSDSGIAYLKKSLAEMKANYEKCTSRFQKSALVAGILHHNNMIRVSQFLQSFDGPIDVVTAFRDPVAREVSGVFQTAGVSHPNLLDKETGEVVCSQGVINHMENYCANYDEAHCFASSWFDRELKSYFGIDLFEHPFPHDIGYLIVDNGRVRVLVMMFEKIATAFPSGAKEFFDLPFAPNLLRENVRKNDDQYREVLKSLHFERADIEKIYESKYVRHFYSPEQIQGFVQNWTS